MLFSVKSHTHAEGKCKNHLFCKFILHIRQWQNAQFSALLNKTSVILNVRNELKQLKRQNFCFTVYEGHDEINNTGFISGAKPTCKHLPQ